MPALEVKDVTVRFGGNIALERVSVSAEAGQVTGLIGPNGAGKTTVFNMLTGVYKPTEGKIFETVDGGNSWKVVNDTNRAVRSMVFVDAIGTGYSRPLGDAKGAGGGHGGREPDLWRAA